MKEFSYEDVTVKVFDNVFYPTETSKMFIDYFKTNHSAFNNASERILDLGCGSGVVSVVLKKIGYENGLCASDISDNAKLNVLENAQINNVDIEVRSGSLYDPWKNEKFDIIIDDISGIAEDVAKASEWFGDSISCESGKDGSALTKIVLDETKNYLKDEGMLFFPILTLSNSTGILEYANSIFDSVEEVSRKSFYLPQEFGEKYKDLIVDLSDKGYIEVEEKFGMYIWETIIYKANFNKKD